MDTVIITFGTSKVKMTDGQIAVKIGKIFKMTPYEIINRFGLKNPIYQTTATYGHFGRTSYEKEVETAKGKKMVTFYPWEKLDYVDVVKRNFGL